MLIRKKVFSPGYKGRHLSIALKYMCIDKSCFNKRNIVEIFKFKVELCPVNKISVLISAKDIRWYRYQEVKILIRTILFKVSYTCDNFPPKWPIYKSRSNWWFYILSFRLNWYSITSCSTISGKVSIKKKKNC